MGVVSLLFSFLARKANDIIQAIFGWSVTALFGRLPRRSQIMVTVALVLSLAWPVFVLGSFLPGVASWAIALVPLHKLIGDTVLRAIWIALAVAAPPLVGLLVWLAAKERRGSVLRALIGGYPMALGFFIAFIVIVVTVPVLKIVSIFKRWSDEHVFVMPHEQRYDAVVKSLAEACARAGVVAKIEDAPPHMVFATTVMRTFARAAVSPFVGDKLKRVVADGIELYLYPADLLLRGRADKVARVRAMFERTNLDVDAYLVGSDEGQAIQKELGRLSRGVDGNPSLLATQLRQIYGQLMNTNIPFSDWMILDDLARRVERRMLAAGIVKPDHLPIDQVADHLGDVEDELRTDGGTLPAWLPAQDRSRFTAGHH